MSPTQRLAPALLGALWITCAAGAPPPAPGASSPPATAPGGRAPGDSLMQSDAMRDALGVAMQAFRFAARHPDASEADKQAKANEIMSRLFQRELDDGASNPHPEPPAPPAGGDDDGG